MKRKLLTIVIAISVLTLSIPAFASGIVISPNSSSAKKGESFFVTVKLDESITAKTGAVEVTLPEGVRVKEGKWLVSSPTLSTFDLAKNKGAFAYSSSKDISGDLITLEFEVTAAASEDRNVDIRIEFREGTNTVFNEMQTLTVAKDNSEALAEAKTSSNEETTSGSEGESETLVIAPAESETSSLENDDNKDEKNAKEHSTNGIIFIIIIAVIILIIIVVVIIIINKKKKISNDIQEENHD